MDRQRLADIIEAVSVIEEAAQSGLDAVKASRITTSAILYNFVVLGEAINRLSDELKQAHPEVQWAEINRFRNFIVHQYFHINLHIIWDIIERDLPELKQQVTRILEEQGQ